MSLQLTIQGPALSAPMNVLITQPRVTIGRASTCDVRLPFATVSSHHLTLERTPQGRYTITDMGSTNGTTINGAPLTAQRPQPLNQGDALAILELQIQVTVNQALEQGFTLAESGTMVRQMVSQALQQAEGSADQAFFEVIRGKDRGRRFMIPDDLEEGKIGRAPQSLIVLSEPCPEHVATLKRQGDGFTLEPTGQGPIKLGAELLSGRQPLRSRQRVHIAEIECIFYDPLQEYLEDLEGGSPHVERSQPSDATSPTRDVTHTTAPHQTTPAPEQAKPAETTAPESLTPPKQQATTDSLELVPATAPPPAAAPSKKGWSTLELVMLVVTALFILGGVGILLVFLGVL